jgi:MCP family monocarboxylic acid transporter-like MFS transporter 10
MLSLCTSYYQIILAQGVGVGLSMGLLFNLAIGIPTHWFQKRRAFALGIQSTGSSLGGVIFPIMIRKLIQEIGYPWTMRLIGFLGLVLLGGSWFFMNTRLPPLQNIKNGGWKKVKWIDPSAFKQWSYTLFVIGCTLILFGLYTPFVYISTFTTQYGIPASDYWLSVMNAASIFGRVVPGLLADRYGRMNTIIPHTALAAIVLFIFPLFTNVSRQGMWDIKALTDASSSQLSIIAFVLIFGYCSGCFVSLIAPSAAQLGPTNTVGTRLGMMFFVMSIGGLLGTPISGYILGSSPPLHWWATAGYSASVVVVGVLFSIAARHCALNGKLRGKI